MSGSMLVASGGLLAPTSIYPKTYQVTYRVKGTIRRWWFRRTGWSTEWTVEYDWADMKPVRDAIPAFTASRGGIKCS